MIDFQSFSDELVKISASKLRSAMKITEDMVGSRPYYTMSLGDEVVGRAALKPNKEISQIQGMELSPKYRGMGLGKKFYGEIMRRQPGETLRSDGSVAAAAQWPWLSMMRRRGGNIGPGFTKADPADVKKGFAPVKPNYDYNKPDARQYMFQSKLPSKSALPSKVREEWE